MKSSGTKAWIYASLVVLFWGTVATAFKIALSGTHYLVLLFIASLTSAGVTFMDLLISNRTGELKKVLMSGKTLGRALIMGGLNPLLYYLVLFKAYSLLPAQIAQPLNYSWQIVLILLISFVFKQKISLRKWIGVIISFVGIVLLAGNGEVSQSGNLSSFGVILALGSSLVWGLYWIISISGDKDKSAIMFVGFIASAIILLPIIIVGDYQLTFKATLASIYVGVFEMGLTFILWGKALHYAKDRVKITQLTYLAPVLSLIFIVLILGERVNYITITGLLLVVGGIFAGSLKE